MTRPVYGQFPRMDHDPGDGMSTVHAGMAARAAETAAENVEMAAVIDMMTVDNIKMVLPGPNTAEGTARIAVEEKTEAGGHLNLVLTTGEILRMAVYCQVGHTLPPSSNPRFDASTASLRSTLKRTVLINWGVTIAVPLTIPRRIASSRIAVKVDRTVVRAQGGPVLTVDYAMEIAEVSEGILLGMTNHRIASEGEVQARIVILNGGDPGVEARAESRGQGLNLEADHSPRTYARSLVERATGPKTAPQLHWGPGDIAASTKNWISSGSGVVPPRCPCLTYRYLHGGNYTMWERIRC